MASLAIVPEPSRISTDSAPVSSHRRPLVRFMSSMKAGERWETGVLAKALLTSGRIATGPGMRLTFRPPFRSTEGWKRPVKSCSRVSSLRYMGWNAASGVPTTGPNGTKPRPRYSFCCATLPEITAIS